MTERLLELIVAMMYLTWFVIVLCWEIAAVVLRLVWGLLVLLGAICFTVWLFDRFNDPGDC